MILLNRNDEVMFVYVHCRTCTRQVDDIKCEIDLNHKVYSKNTNWRNYKYMAITCILRKHENDNRRGKVIYINYKLKASNDNSIKV